MACTLWAIPVVPLPYLAYFTLTTAFYTIMMMPGLAHIIPCWFIVTVIFLWADTTYIYSLFRNVFITIVHLSLPAIIVAFYLRSYPFPYFCYLHCLKTALSYCNLHNYCPLRSACSYAAYLWNKWKLVMCFAADIQWGARALKCIPFILICSLYNPWQTMSKNFPTAS